MAPVTGMVLTNFKPDVWERRLARKLGNQLIFTQAGIANRNYEGDVHVGSSVRVFNMAEVAISDYTANTDMGAPDTLSVTSDTMTIDQAKKYHFYLDDVDRVALLTDLLNDAGDSAAYGLANEQDTYARDLMLAATPAFAIGAGQLTPSNVFPRLIIPARNKLTRANIDEQGRYLIIPPEISGVLMDPAGPANQVLSDADSVIRNGNIGRLATLDLIETNKVAENPAGIAAFSAGASVTPGFVFTSGGNYWVVESVSGSAPFTLAGTAPTAAVGASEVSNEAVVRNIGATTATLYKSVVGVPEAFAFANDIQKSEAYRPERRFGAAVKGLNVYGGKVFRADMLGHVYMTLA